MIYYGSINNNKCFSVDLVNWIGGLAMAVLNRSIEFNSILPSVRCSLSLCVPPRFPLICAIPLCIDGIVCAEHWVLFGFIVIWPVPPIAIL